MTERCEKNVNPLTGLIGISLQFSYEYSHLIDEAIIKYTAETQNSLKSDVAGPSVVSTNYNSMYDKLEEVHTYHTHILDFVSDILFPFYRC